jgi:hypothetical protein
MAENNWPTIETETTVFNATKSINTNKQSKSQNFLCGARVYLSGPMDFVAARGDERKFGWRNRVSDFLRQMEATVFDPWFKPAVRGLENYGVENADTINAREKWTFEQSQAGDEARAECAEHFWSTLHIDLRMVDTSDFTIAYCPTNIYSVGTAHEIILSRQQSKPVLFVSPPIVFPALDLLREHLKNDAKGLELLEKLTTEVPIKTNPNAIPSLWYMPLIDGAAFFDGFGFKPYVDRFKWTKIPIDDQEDRHPPKNPLLPYLEKLTKSIPKRWDNKLKRYVTSDDWLLWELDNSRDERRGSVVLDVHGGKEE